MSEVHATFDNGRRILVEIQCDSCDNIIKPHADIAESGWIVNGWSESSGHKYYLYLCPGCQRINY